MRCALRLAPLVFVRPGELRKAEWKDIDLDGSEWRYTVTKTNTPHIVPLSTQAVEILKELQGLTGRSRFVFPGARTNGRPMSDNAILAALRRMGIDKEEMSGHGFRAMARTILDEVLGVRPDFIEHQLAHSVRDPNGRAYNRTAHLPERRKMMQQWADYLDKLKAGAEIIPLHGGIKKRVLEKTMSEDNTWPWGLRKPNWDAWQSVQQTRLWHAVALACDLDPGNFQLFDRPQLARSFKEPPKQFEDLLVMAKGNIGANGVLKLLSRSDEGLEESEVKLSNFATWLKSIQYPIPAQFPWQSEPFTLSNSIGRGAGTKRDLLRKLAGAAQRFWSNYDPADPTTAPTNQQVIDWLKGQGVSERTAEIMATILRADGLPTGPRK